MRLPRLVMKFGGTSLADGQAIARVVDLIVGRLSRRPIIIVSAAAGVTEQLARMTQLARDGRSYEHLLIELRDRHERIAADLEVSADAARVELQDLAMALGTVAREGTATPRAYDQILPVGEAMLAPIVAARMKRAGITARSWRAAELGLVTDARFTRARPLPECYERIAATLQQCDEHLAVVTGFSAQTLSGVPTTLGRGGSDLTASIIARAVAAEELEIWTDVDGILTADPRIVGAARPVEEMGFREASELAWSGARVLHPQTIIPAMAANIPVRVLNSLRPGEPGTRIVSDAELVAGSREGWVRSIAHRSDVCVVTVLSPRMIARSGFLARIANAFENHGVSVDMIASSEISVSLTLDEDVESVPRLLEELRSFADVEIARGLATVSVVGNRLADECGLFADVFSCLASRGIEIEMISYGTAGTNLSLLLAQERVAEAVQALHERYFGPRPPKGRDSPEPSDWAGVP